MFKNKMNLKHQLDEKKMDYDVFRQQIGVDEKVFEELLAEELKQIDRDTLTKLCYFLNCQIGDLLIYTEE